MTHRLSTLLVLTVSVAAVSAQAPEVLGTLKLGVRPAEQGVVNAIAFGSVATGLAADGFKALPASARAGVVTEAIAWVKGYVTSPAFKTAYAAFREERKPKPPEFKGTVDDEIKAQDAEQARRLAESRKNLDKMPPDIRKAVEDSLKQSEAMFTSPEFAKMRRQGIEMERTQRQNSYQTSLKEWEVNLPADPNPLVATRLKTFLQTSANVNFEAKLEKKDGAMKFVDPALERQSAEWKFCYRAGREAVAAARTAAQAWLSEL